MIPRTTFSKDDEAELLSAVHETSRIKRHAATSQQQCLTDHIRLISHQRKQILLIDLSNCSAAEVGKVFRAVSEFVTTRPRGSVLILSDFTGRPLTRRPFGSSKKPPSLTRPMSRNPHGREQKTFLGRLLRAYVASPGANFPFLRPGKRL